MASFLSAFMLNNSQDFLGNYSHRGDNVECQKKIRTTIDNFDISDHVASFEDFSESKLPEHLRGKNFLETYVDKLLREFWFYPQLFQTRKENTPELLNQLLEINNIIRRVLDDTYKQLDPPEEFEKRIVAKIKAELFTDIISHIDEKFEGLMRYFEDGETEVQSSVGGSDLETKYVESEPEFDTEKINVEIDVSENDADIVDAPEPVENDDEIIQNHDDIFTLEDDDIPHEPKNVQTAVPIPTNGGHADVAATNAQTVGAAQITKTAAVTENITPITQEIPTIESKQPGDSGIVTQVAPEPVVDQLPADDIPHEPKSANTPPIVVDAEICDSAIPTSEKNDAKLAEINIDDIEFPPKKTDRKITIRRFGDPDIFGVSHSIL